MEKILNECPVCGHSLEFHIMYQDTDAYNILKNGKLSKNRNRRKTVRYPMDASFISCSDLSCEFVTDSDFNIIRPYGLKGFIDRRSDGTFVIDVDTE